MWQWSSHHLRFQGCPHPIFLEGAGGGHGDFQGGELWVYDPAGNKPMKVERAMPGWPELKPGKMAMGIALSLSQKKEGLEVAMAPSIHTQTPPPFLFQKKNVRVTMVRSGSHLHLRRRGWWSWPHPGRVLFCT